MSEIICGKILQLRPLLRLSKSGLINVVVLILNTEYSKCPISANKFLAKLLLLCSCFLKKKILSGMAKSVNPLGAFTVNYLNFISKLPNTNFQRDKNHMYNKSTT